MVNQRAAVKMVAASLRRARAELREGKRPIANFLFLGPTGVGKTELAKTVAEGNELYREELINQAEKILNAVSKEIVEFFRNPDTYKPGQVLDEIEGLTGRPFLLEVLKTRRLGVSLK